VQLGVSSPLQSRLPSAFRLSERAIIGVTGVITTVPLVEVIGVGIGDIELPPFQAGVLELSHLRLGIQAVFGVNVFVGRRLQIDFGEGRIYVL
jgi:hypothetical protein